MSATPQTARTYINLAVGDPAPTFVQSLGGGEPYPFHKAAGRYVVLCFFGSAADAAGARAMEAAYRRRGMFDDVRASFFGVTVDRGDDAHARLRPDIHCFRDYDGSIARAYGVLPRDFAPQEGGVPARRF